MQRRITRADAVKKHKKYFVDDDDDDDGADEKGLGTAAAMQALKMFAGSGSSSQSSSQPSSQSGQSTFVALAMAEASKVSRKFPRYFECTWRG